MTPEQKHIFIEGTKDGFNSKIAIEKFKKTLKKMDIDGNINLDELQKKYIKSNYKLELINNNTSRITINVS